MNKYSMQRSVLYSDKSPIGVASESSLTSVTVNNASHLQAGIDYNIADKKIIFNNGSVENNDIICIKEEFTSSIPIMSKNKRGRALYYAEKKDVILHNNTKYDICITFKNGINSTSSFTSAFSPFYLKFPRQALRTEIGNLVDEFDDSVLTDVVYQSSKEYDNMYSKEDLSSEEETEEQSDLKIKFVKYKSCIDLLVNKYINKSMGPSEEKLSVGTLEFIEKSKLPEIESLLKKFKSLLGDSTFKLDTLSDKSVSKSFVKAGSTKYPGKKRSW